MARAAEACDFPVIVTRLPPSFIAGSRCLGKIWTQFARILEGMTGNISWPRTSALAGPLLLMVLLPGCDAMNGARGDLGRMTTAKTTPAPARPATAAARPVPSKAATTPAPQVASAPAAATTAVDDNPATLVGRNEGEIRALFGTPAGTDEVPPGKVWHYRDGNCALDVRLYPDVQTRLFATLAYEVKSDDNSEQGKRACLAQLRNRAHVER